MNHNGEVAIKKTLDYLHFFTPSACLNSFAILDSSCGGANIVDAAMYDATTICKHTVDANSIKGDCTTESNSISGFGYFWNATWMNSERQEFLSPPKQFPRLTQFGRKSCLVTFVRSFTFGARPENSLSSGFLIDDFLDQWEEQHILG